MSLAVLYFMSKVEHCFQSYGQYWPGDETCECGPFVIDPVSVDTTNKDITVRELKLTYQPEVSLLLSFIVVILNV